MLDEFEPEGVGGLTVSAYTICILVNLGNM